MEQKANVKREFTGKVISAAMQKTITVQVDRTKIHPKYKKQYVVSKKYHVHDEHGTHKVGDVVTFTQCRPLSKTKCWLVVTK